MHMVVLRASVAILIFSFSLQWLMWSSFLNKSRNFSESVKSAIKKEAINGGIFTAKSNIYEKLRNASQFSKFLVVKSRGVGA